MSRPKLAEEIKKVKLNLTISPEAKKMLDEIRISKNQSISEWVEDCIRKEYRKVKRGE